MDTIWLSSANIAEHEGIDHGICRKAVDRVIDHYKPSNYRPYQIATMLEEYIMHSENKRAVVLQFRQYVQEMTQAQETQK